MHQEPMHLTEKMETVCCREAKRCNWYWLAGIAVVLIIAGALKFAWYASEQPDSNLYQMVVLDNGQTYYGKLHAVRAAYPYLTEVFYLQPKEKTDDKGRLTAPTDFEVIKRGFELHSPIDRMYIARSKIVFWENVGPISLVARGIEAKKEQVRKANEPQPQAPQL